MPPARRTRVRKTPPAPGETPLQDEVTVGELPPTKDRPPGQWRGFTTTITADPQSEYVSAGGYAWYANYARSLPRAVDDVTRDFGADLYERMMLDAKVANVVTVFKASILEEGVTLWPSVKDEKDPRHDDAVTMAKWCSAALEEMASPFDAVLWDLLDSVALGNRVAEIVWKLAADNTGRQCLLPDVIHPKPRLSTAFVTDSFMTVLGLLGLLPGQATMVQPNLLMMDLSEVPNFLPRDKFMIATFRPRNADPRGTSILRPAYDPWWLKQQGKPEWLKAVSQWAGPSVVGITPPGAEAQTMDSVGNLLPVPISPELQMATQLATLRNGTALAFPYGSDVKPMTVASDVGRPFLTFEDWCDAQIVAAVLNQSLSTEDATHQTGAASKTHENVKDMIIRQAKKAYTWMIRHDLLRLMVLYNFGEKALHYVPQVALGAAESYNFAEMATGVAALQSSGYIGASQKPGIDKKLDLPLRDTEADAKAAAVALATAQAMAASSPGDAPAMRAQGKQDAGNLLSGDQALGTKGQPAAPQTAKRGGA